MKTPIYYASMLIVFILLGVTALTYSGDEPFNKVISPKKSIISNGGYVIVKGRWKKSGGTSKLNTNNPPIINTVDVVCDKGSMTCEEYIAKLVTTKDIGSTYESPPMLTIDTTMFKVIDWSDDTIIAKASFFPSDYMLRISVKDNYAERLRQETKARGDKSADPNIYEKWLLE